MISLSTNSTTIYSIYFFFSKFVRDDLTTLLTCLNSAIFTPIYRDTSQLLDHNNIYANYPITYAYFLVNILCKFQWKIYKIKQNK